MQQSQHILQIFQTAQQNRRNSNFRCCLQSITKTFYLNPNFMQLLHILHIGITLRQQKQLIAPGRKPLPQKAAQPQLTHFFIQGQTVQHEQKVQQSSSHGIDTAQMQHLFSLTLSAFLQQLLQLQRLFSILLPAAANLHAGHQRHIILSGPTQHIRPFFEFCFPVQQLSLWQKRFKQCQ